MNRQKVLYALAAPVTALVSALVVTALALLAGGNNPWVAYTKMVDYAASVDSLVVITNKSLPLFVSGLAVAIGFKMNLFNIGVEGQYRLATIGAAAIGAELSLPGPVHVAVIMLVGMIIGAMYASIAGFLKAYRNVNEVIATIMLNGISASIIGLMLKWKDVFVATGFSRGTKPLPESGRMFSLNSFLDKIGLGLPKGTVLWGWLLIAIVLGVVFHVVVNRTRFGFDLRASGTNEPAAVASGVDVKRMVLTSMLLSGAVAGLVGMPILLGAAHSFGSQDFPAGIGFTGIAIALLGRNNPVGIAFASVLWGFLDVSNQILDIQGIPKEIVTIMQGTVVLAVVIAYEMVRRISVASEQRRVLSTEQAAPAAPAVGATSGGAQ